MSHARARACAPPLLLPLPLHYAVPSPRRSIISIGGSAQTHLLLFVRASSSAALKMESGGPMPTAPGPVATAGVAVATPAVSGVPVASAEAAGAPVVNGAFAMPPAKAIQKRRTSLPKEAPPSDVSSRQLQ